jgi:glucosylceramidase
MAFVSRPGGIGPRHAAPVPVPPVVWVAAGMLALGGVSGTAIVLSGGHPAADRRPATTRPAPTPPRSAADPAVPRGAIVGLAGRCIDVEDGSDDDGAGIQMATCSGASNQVWTARSDGTLRALGKCLDIVNGATANGSPVQLYRCDGTGEQQWVFTGQRWINPRSDKCLDVTDREAADGVPLQIWSCVGASNQRWTRPGGG